MPHRWVTEIIWDTDGEDIPELPKTVALPYWVNEEDAVDYLSDEYGFCIFSCSVATELEA